MINLFKKQAQAEPADTVIPEPQNVQGLPNLLMKGGMAIGGISLLMVLFSFGGSLFSSAPTVGQPTVISMPEASPSPTATAEPSTQTRDEAWNRLKASVTALEQSTNDLDTQLRAARAQRWLTFAASRCQELDRSGCSSPRSLLLDYYLGSASALQNKIRTGQIPVDAPSVKEWREKIADLRDIAQALNLEITGVQPIPFVATADVSAAMDGVYTDAAKFDSLRQQQQLQQFEKSKATPSPALIQEGKE